MNVLKTFPNSIATRLVLLMSLALLPLGLISIYQTYAVVEEARSVSRAGLLSETEAAAGRERELIVQALGAAGGLGTALNITDPEACEDTLEAFVRENALYIFAGFVPVSGLMTCSSSDSVVDFSDDPGLAIAIEKRGALVQLNLSGPATGQSVIVASQPVERDGVLQGFLSLSVPHWVANALLFERDSDTDLQLASINDQGHVVAATGGVDAAQTFLPMGIDYSSIGDLVGQTMRGRSADGTPRFFAVSAMVDDTLYLIGSKAIGESGQNGTVMRAGFAIFFPVAMWFAGMGVAYFGLRRLVVRHISRLRSAMRRFALGDRSEGGLQLDNPPDELAEAQRAFNRMALIISDAEARRENDLRDKEVLLKEVHHRVKNNLQLIASIMNMQSRNAKTPEARQMLDGLQRRVRGLAMLHRSLYATPEETTVDAAELVTTVVDDVSNLAADKKLQIKTDLAKIPLYPDQAVPLSMLLAEALTNALKYTGTTPDGKTEIHVGLQEQDGNLLQLSVSNTLGEQVREKQDESDEGDGLGSRLMRAFVSQLDGTDEREIDETRYCLVVTFPRRDFVPET